MADISLVAGERSFDLHKFILASRTPYFRKKLQSQPDTSSWKLSPTIPVEAFQIAVRYVYLGTVPRDLVPPNSSVTEEEVVKGLDKISKDLEIEQLWAAILAGSDRRLARQRYQDEVERALKQINDFFRQNVIGHKMIVDADRVSEVRWKHDNAIFADVLLRADEALPPEEEEQSQHPETTSTSIPIGPTSTNGTKSTRKAVLYPVHKAMLIRSEYFSKMFSGEFIESIPDTTLRIVTVDCTPPVLELILTFLYTESTDAITLDHALDLLYTADMLFLDTLKNKAAVAISTLGSGSTQVNLSGDANDAIVEVESVNIYDVIHAAWDLNVQRLEEFAARYLADRLEDYIDEEEFQDVIRESASRLRSREETDTIELLDDIRYYLSERFRHRFEDTGLEEVMDENGEISAEAAAAIADQATAVGNGDNGALKQQGVVQSEVIQENGESAAPTLNQKEEEVDEDDEFASDAINYQLLLGKIDVMLDRLKLDA